MSVALRNRNRMTALASLAIIAGMGTMVYYAVPLYRLFHHRFSDATTNSLIHLFACEYGGPIVFQPEEVAGGGWTTQAEATEMAEAGRICPDSARGWALFRQKYRGGGGGHATLPGLIAQGLEAINCGQ